MSITVNDPGLKKGQVVFQWRPYNITLERNGEVFKIIEVSPQLYYYTVCAYIVAQVTLITTLVVYGVLTLDALLSWANPWAMLFLLQLTHLGFSLRIVKENEIGGLLFFGRPTKLAASGLVFAPWGLLSLVKLPRNPIQIQFPGDPEQIYRDSDKEYFRLSEEERQRLVLPIRAVTGGPDQEDSGSEKHILDTQMTIEPSFFVRWTIEHYWVFLIRIGSTAEANRQLRDSGEMVTIKEVAKRTPRKLIAEIGKISRALRKQLELSTEDWGIMIDEASMLSPDIGKSVNTALQDITVAKANASKTAISAEAEKKKRTLEGEGAAAAKRADLSALATGSKELGVTGNDVVDLEKTRALANGKTTIFVDGGQGASLLGIGARFTSGADASRQAAASGEMKDKES